MENLNAEKICKELVMFIEDMHADLHLGRNRTIKFREFLISTLLLITSQEQRIKELAEENERLHASCTELTQCCTKLETLYKIESKRVDTTKADTVRQMQKLIKERCIKGGIYPVLVARTIEQVAKEILEGEK